MLSLKSLLDLESCRIMLSGDPKRLFSIYAKRWFRGKKVLANSLPFELRGNFSIKVGDPFNSRADAYIITNPLGMGEELYSWLSDVDTLTVLYEERYVGSSIRRMKLRRFIDYLLAYRRETVDREIVSLYHLESGKVVESRTFVRIRN